MTNSITAFSFDKEVNMSRYFTEDMPYSYETVKETIFNFNGTRIWIDFREDFLVSISTVTFSPILAFAKKLLL